MQAVSDQVSKWCAYTRYVWSAKQIDQWADNYGPRAFYNGALVELRYKKITPGRFEVWFEKVN